MQTEGTRLRFSKSVRRLLMVHWFKGSEVRTSMHISSVDTSTMNSGCTTLGLKSKFMVQQVDLYEKWRNNSIESFAKTHLFHQALPRN